MVTSYTPYEYLVVFEEEKEWKTFVTFLPLKLDELFYTDLCNISMVGIPADQNSFKMEVHRQYMKPCILNIG